MLKKKIAAALAAVMAVTAVMATSAMAGPTNFGFSFANGVTSTGYVMKSGTVGYANVNIQTATAPVYYQVYRQSIDPPVTDRVLIYNGQSRNLSYYSGHAYQFTNYKLQGSGAGGSTMVGGVFTP
ncbi:hypothetical protein [Massilioclostridium coli]|uniref:hypothetical protein n=1 Tax=Massilioclostridium coli TaxID=1870991 RepID=UPI0022E4A04D|nr:hypothetical protein [Massilioclostridium coli]